MWFFGWISLPNIPPDRLLTLQPHPNIKTPFNKNLFADPTPPPQIEADKQAPIQNNNVTVNKIDARYIQVILTVSIHVHASYLLR